LKKLFAAIFASFMLVVGSVNATVITMTDGTLAVYNPDNTYVPSGTLGSDVFSIGFTYTDPTYSNDINLAMPIDMPGTTFWALTAGIDGTGLWYEVGALVAGESTSVLMGGFPQASLSNHVTQWFSMVNYDILSPIAFGPTVEDSLISFPGIDDGIGDGGAVSPIPEPGTAWLLLAGLGFVGLAANRRKKSITPVS
jgi:hypothetical protein